MAYMICNLVEGRGKTGKAKNGPVRMLFADNESHDAFNAFIRECYCFAIRKFKDGVPEFAEYLENSRKNLLHKKIPDVCDYTAGTGGRLFLVNRSSINPQINIESTIRRRFEEENCCAN